ncbi:HEPN domain-containing protein [Bacteroidota bacterium]
MTIVEHIKFWLDSAEDDLESATINYESNRYNWCLFIGHLALEKALKANFVRVNENKVPPKIHDLIKLSALSNIELDEETKQFFYILNKFNLEARYPEYKSDMSKIATKEFTSETFNKIKEKFKWLKSLTI